MSGPAAQGDAASRRVSMVRGRCAARNGIICVKQMKHFATVMCMAFAATALAPSVRPPAVAEETKAEMARYGAVFSRGQSPVDSLSNFKQQTN